MFSCKKKTYILYTEKEKREENGNSSTADELEFSSNDHSTVQTTIHMGD